MADITYTDKDKTGSDGIVNKWRDVDANEVKTAVNSKADDADLTAEATARAAADSALSTAIGLKLDKDMSSLTNLTAITGSEKIPVSGTNSLTPILLNGGLVNQQTDSYTLVLTDAFKIVEQSKATDITLTVPPNSSVAFPTGTRIWLRRTGVGVVTVTQGVGVTVTASAVVLTDPGLGVEMCLRKTGTNTWDLQNGAPVSETTWTPTNTGMSVQPTQTCFYTLEGTKCTIWNEVTAHGTSSATTYTMTAPFASKYTLFFPVIFTDNLTTTVGRATMAAGSNIMTFGLSANSAGGFTASGNKSVRLSGLSYIIQ